MLLDESGSMKQGDRIHHAKALWLVLLTIARRQRRAMHLIRYSGRGEMKQHTWLTGCATLQEVTTIGSEMLDGGTWWDQAYTAAAEVLREAPEFKQADIIHLTDAEQGYGSPLASEQMVKQVWPAVREQFPQMRATTILLGNAQGARAVAEPLSNEVIHLDTILGREEQLSGVLGL